MLREADANGDGKVSKEELTELLTGNLIHTDVLSQYDPRIKDGAEGLTQMHESLSDPHSSSGEH